MNRGGITAQGFKIIEKVDKLVYPRYILITCNFLLIIAVFSKVSNVMMHLEEFFGWLD